MCLQTKEERLKNAAKDSHLLERSNRVLWKDLAHHVAGTDKTLQMILKRFLAIEYSSKRILQYSLSRIH